MNTVMTKTDERARRQQHQARYRPRVAVASLPASAVAVEDLRLRRLTAQVLEDLKRPDAIPSRVVMAALAQAKTLGSR